MKPIKYLKWLIRIILATAFVFAAIPKIRNPMEFALSVEGFQLISGKSALWVALFLPWLELIAGVGLLTSHIRRGSNLLISVLLLFFIGLHASAWIRGLDISCGCFGIKGVSNNYLLLITRNSLLLIMGLYLLIHDWHNSFRKNISAKSS